MGGALKRKKVIIAVAEKAAALIKSGWTRGAEARDTRRQAVFASSADAKCFCAIGALLRAMTDCGAYDRNYHAYDEIRHRYADKIGAEIVTHNDKVARHKSHVIAVFTAIAADIRTELETPRSAKCCKSGRH
ncbi:MAG: DUF6197 family protein [Gammaproteobacteria bacterium]